MVKSKKTQVFPSFDQATQFVVSEWTRRNVQVPAPNDFVECTECGFSAKPTQRVGERNLIWLSMVNLRPLCQEHSHQERLALRNKAKDALLEKTPALSPKEAWEITANLVGITGITLLSAIVAFKNAKNPELEASVRELLREEVPCALTAITGETRMIRRSQGCELNHDAIVAIMGDTQRTVEQRQLALLIHENISGVDTPEGELPPFVAIDTVNTVLVRALGGSLVPMLDDGEGRKFRPRLFTLGHEVIRKFAERAQNVGDEKVVESELLGSLMGMIPDNNPSLSTKIGDIVLEEARRRENSRHRKSSDWKRKGSNRKDD